MLVEPSSIFLDARVRAAVQSPWGHWWTSWLIWVNGVNLPPLIQFPSHGDGRLGPGTLNI